MLEPFGANISLQLSSQTQFAKIKNKLLPKINVKNIKIMFSSDRIISLKPQVVSIVLVLTSFGPRCEKICLRGFLNIKDADQPAHPSRLISTFVIRFLESLLQAKFHCSS